MYLIVFRIVCFSDCSNEEEEVVESEEGGRAEFWKLVESEGRLLRSEEDRGGFDGRR